MPQRRVPSEANAQAIAARLQGHTTADSGEELWSPLVPRAPARGRPEAVEREPTEGLGRQRSARDGAGPG
jgi:hypothetical protein